MRITYVGRHAEGVDVVHEKGPTHVEHGKTVDLPKPVATSLLEQGGEWQEKKPKKPTTRAGGSSTDANEDAQQGSPKQETPEA